MFRILVLSILLFQGVCSAGGLFPTHMTGDDGGGGTTYYYMGSPTTGGVPDTAAVGSWVTYGGTPDRCYFVKVPAADHSGGTADGIQFRRGSIVTHTTEILVLYNGTTHVGRTASIDGTGSANSWLPDYQSLTAESGESLTFATTDDIYIGYCSDNAGAGSYASRDNGAADANWQVTAPWTTDPPSPASFLSVTYRFGLVLKYH